MDRQPVNIRVCGLGHALCCSPRLARHVPEGVVRQCVNARSKPMRAGPQSGGYRARRSPRHPVYVRAILQAHGTCHRIHIVDYSQHGFRLERVSGIEPQQRVTVELPSGQRLPMLVLWVKEDRAGVRFLGPIAPGHTVMRWLDQSASKHKLLRSSSARA
jgi:hypothetical protein